MQRPGKIATHGRDRMLDWALASMLPHDAVGGWIPKPRNESADSRDDDVGDLERRLHDDRRDRVGQEMPENDPAVVVAERPRGFGELALAQAQERGSHETRDAAATRDRR